MLDGGVQDHPVCERCRGPLDEDGETCPACEAEGGEFIALSPQEPQPQDETSGRQSGKQDRQVSDLDRRQAMAGGDSAFIENMNKVRRSGLPSVVFIGFKAAGKTWMVHRFLEQISVNADCYPAFDPVDAIKEPEGRDLGASTAFSTYRVMDSNKPYWLIDTPGEETALLMSLGSEAENMPAEAWKEAWKIVAALHQASAVVIALPADVMFFGPSISGLIHEKALLTDAGAKSFLGELNAGKEGKGVKSRIKALQDWARSLSNNHSDMETFVRGIINAVAALSYVRAADIDPLDPVKFRSGVSRDKVLEHRADKRKFSGWGEGDGLDCPTFFALTKADLVISSMLGSVPGDKEKLEMDKRRNEMLERPDIKAMRALATKGGMLDDRSRFPLAHPSDCVRELNPALHNRLIENFALGRFDYVTAFFGHDGSTRLMHHHYKHFPPLGVREMREWIRDARQLRFGWMNRRRLAAARRLHMALHGIGKADVSI